MPKAVKSPPPLYTMEVGPDGSHGQGGAIYFWFLIVFSVLMNGCAPKWAPPSFNLEELAPFSNIPGSEDDLYAQGLLARKDGDAISAIARFSTLERQGSTNPNVLYQLAISFEVAEDFQTAAAIYVELKSRRPSPDLWRDANFRLALCLWELGENQAAYRAIQSIPDNVAFNLQDRYTYDLALGTAWIRIGRTTKGVRRVLEALVSAEGSQETHWMRSMALFSLMELELDQANTQNFQVRENKQKIRLSNRVSHIHAAENLLRRIMTLREVDWMLAGWLALGDAYVNFAEDLAQAPPPRKLNDRQKQVYSNRIKEQAEVLRLKAAKAYEWGIEVATRSARQDHRNARLLVSQLKELSP
jgi:tetratricopeptide (TPR) repeat protein